MKKANKLLNIIFSILLIITEFNYSVFADEIDENESNNPDTNEVSDESKIDEIETKIKDINIKLNNVEKSVSNLENLTPGSYGKLTNFNKMSELQFNWYLNNYLNYPLICIYNSNNYLGYCNESDLYRVRQSGTNYYFDIYRINILEPLGYTQVVDFTNSSSGYNTLYFYINNISDENSIGYYQAHFNNVDYYSLNPYSINVKNNGLNDYSITPESIYNLGYYPSGSSVTISYDNSINDFFGYFDINGNLLSSNTSYTFDITENTNIVINYRSKEGIDYYPYLIYIILLLTLLFFTQIEKGILNGN